MTSAQGFVSVSLRWMASVKTRDSSSSSRLTDTGLRLRPELDRGLAALALELLHGRAYFLCGCSCGKTRVASSLKLKGGVVRACRDCARAPHQEEARRISGLTAAEIIAKWQDHYNAFTAKQRRAYFRLIAERRAAGLVVNDLARAAAVLRVLRVWAERTLEHAGREVG